MNKNDTDSENKDPKNQSSDIQIDFGMYFVFTPILLWGYACLVCPEMAIPMTVFTLLIGYAIPHIFIEQTISHKVMITAIAHQKRMINHELSSRA